ncbi:MAG: hypothetical protein RJA22_575 [Verrucomicrobiota bacterium]|jgi:ABC-type methionine transport system ATPase subunit
MPAKPRKPAPARAKAASIDRRRVWLTYPPQKIKRPVIWELGHKFKLVTDIRQASVNDEVGIVCLELDGPKAEIDAGIAWLEKSGVKVEPVEISVIAG